MLMPPTNFLMMMNVKVVFVNELFSSFSSQYFSLNNLLMNDNINKVAKSCCQLLNWSNIYFYLTQKSPFSRYNLIQKDIYDTTIVQLSNCYVPIRLLLNGRRKSPLGHYVRRQGWIQYSFPSEAFSSPPKPTCL